MWDGREAVVVVGTVLDAEGCGAGVVAFLADFKASVALYSTRNPRNLSNDDLKPGNLLISSCRKFESA